MTTQTPVPTTRRLSPAVLLGGAFALTTLLNIVMQVAAILFTDQDPYAQDGPVSSIKSIAVVGGLGLVLALAIALPLSRSPHRAKLGAFVLGALAIVTVPLFWSGAPAVAGAAAAWLGGLARGSHPQTGAARAFGIVGVVIAVLDIVAILFGTSAALLSG